MSARFPILSNPLSPSDADLLLYAQYMADIARSCNIYAEPGQPDSPWETIGYMRGASQTLVQWLIARMERDAELAERLAREAQDEMSKYNRHSKYDAETGIAKTGEI